MVIVISIGEKIKKVRKDKGWSLRELSLRMGYSNHSTVARIENGTVDIPQSRIVQFAEVLGVSVAYLMGWDDEKKNPGGETRISDKKQALMDFVASVPEEKADLILRVIRSIVQDG